VTLFTYYIPQWDSTLVQWPPSNNSHTFGRVDQDKHLPRLVAEAIVQVGHEQTHEGVLYMYSFFSLYAQFLLAKQQLMKNFEVLLQPCVAAL